MGDLRLNTRYLSTNRGGIKIAQIIIGFVISGLLCGAWWGWGGSQCYVDGRLGYCTTLNSIVVIINIILFILNLINFGQWKLERYYSIICVILFAIAAGIMIWYLVVYSGNGYTVNGYFIAATILMAIEFFLFVWDVKILQLESPN